MTDRQTEPTANVDRPNGGSWEYIAMLVIIFSGSGLVAVAIAVLWISFHAASLGGMDAWHENSRLVFNTLTPIFTTWVGTVRTLANKTGCVPTVMLKRAGLN